MIRTIAISVVVGLSACFPAQGRAQSQPDTASNAQDEQINVLIPPQPGGTLEGSLLIIRTDDTNADTDYHSRIYELEVEGWEILPYLRDIVDQEAGSVNFWTYPDPQTGRERHFVQAVTADYQFEDIEALVEAFNRPGATSHRGGMRRHVRVRHRLASDLAEILGNGVISQDGFVEADDATNTLFIRDSQSDGRRAMEVLRYYDVPQRMVEMEIRILEVDVTDERRLGLDWDAWKRSLGGFIQFSDAERSGIPADFTSFDTLLNLDARVLADFLNYLVKEGEASVVTHTTLTAINGESAQLESSRRVPVIRSEPSPGVIKRIEGAPEIGGELLAEEGGLRSRLRDKGNEEEIVSIRIFPRIGAETMLAEISAFVSSVTGENRLGEPGLTRSRVDSIVRLHDGEPVLVGAFDQSREVLSRSGIPLLRSIPWIGPGLFQVSGKSKRQTKLVVLMTPQVDELLRYTDEQIDYGRRIQLPEAAPFMERTRNRIAPGLFQSPLEMDGAAPFDEGAATDTRLHETRLEPRTEL